jgi:hypothetical protein
MAQFQRKFRLILFIFLWSIWKVGRQSCNRMIERSLRPVLFSIRPRKLSGHFVDENSLSVFFSDPACAETSRSRYLQGRVEQGNLLVVVCCLMCCMYRMSWFSLCWRTYTILGIDMLLAVCSKHGVTGSAARSATSFRYFAIPVH